LDVSETPTVAFESFGELSARVVAGPPGAPLVVLAHGYDSSAFDLEHFAAALRMPLTWIFPEAPIELASPPGTQSTRGMRGTRAWWPIDVVARDEAVAKGLERDLSSQEFPGLVTARAQLDAALDVAWERYAPSALVLGGFSQGAILACDLALRSSRRLAALVLLSGARVSHAEWTRLYATRAGLPAFVSHGRHDPMLSFRVAEELAGELAAAGLPTTFVPFEGEHEVPLLPLRELRKFLGRILALGR
jgi:phospholipase/carboxylesterase